MKLHWKILIALVVGALITGQVVAFRAVAAMNENLENAHTALAAALAAMEKANTQHEAMVAQWSKMNKMSGMSAMDKEMMKMGGMAAGSQKAMMDAMSQSLKAIEQIWKYDTGNKK